MTNYPIEDDLEEPPFSTSPALSVVQSVQFMIEGDRELSLPRAYETVAGGTIFERLKFCRERAEENYARRFPDEDRSKADLAKANHAMQTASRYLLALQNELPTAKNGLHPLLQWAGEMRGSLGNCRR